MLKSAVLCLFLGATIVASQDDCQALQQGMVNCMGKHPQDTSPPKSPEVQQERCKSMKALADCLRTTSEQNKCSGQAGSQTQGTIDGILKQYKMMCAQFEGQGGADMVLEMKCSNLTQTAAQVCNIGKNPEVKEKMTEEEKKKMCETVQKGAICFVEKLKGQGCESTQSMKQFMGILSGFDEKCANKDSSSVHFVASGVLIIVSVFIGALM